MGMDGRIFSWMVTVTMPVVIMKILVFYRPSLEALAEGFRNLASRTRTRLKL
jgi:hypothetical protein